MTAETFSWLHLTDFHYGLKGQKCLWPTLREPFLDSLAELHRKCGPWHVVFFTGDLVQSGEPSQFAEMQQEVLDRLWQKLSGLGSGTAVLLSVPGNHDLMRPKIDAPDFDDPAMETLLKPDGFRSTESKFWDQPSGSYRRAINGVFSAYSDWWQNNPRRPPSVKSGILPGDSQRRSSVASGASASWV